MSEKIKCPVCDDDCSERGIVGHLMIIHEYELEGIIEILFDEIRKINKKLKSLNKMLAHPLR